MVATATAEHNECVYRVYAQGSCFNMKRSKPVQNIITTAGREGLGHIVHPVRKSFRFYYSQFSEIIPLGLLL